MKQNLIIAGLLFLLIAGCVSSSDKTTYVCPDGGLVSHPKYCLSVDQKSDDSESLLDKDYRESVVYDSNPNPVSNQKTSCPYECCISSSKYSDKYCSSNYQCVNNSCVMKSCPHDCCPGTNYLKKNCSSGYQCSYNSCVKIPQPKISAQIFSCKTTINVTKGLGEVTDISVGIGNPGDAPAKNVRIHATANDATQDISSSYAIVGTLNQGTEGSYHLVVDTESDIPTTISVIISADGFDDMVLSTSNCHYDPEEVAGWAKIFIPLG